MKKILKIILKVIIGIAILIVILLVITIFTNKNKNTSENNFIRSAYLEKIPAGTQYTPGMQGVFTTTFKKDDQISMKGETISFIGKTTLTVKIAKEGASATQDAMPPMMVKSGSFGFCCISVPTELGKYYLHIYTEGKEETLSPLSFEVVQ